MRGIEEELDEEREKEEKRYGAASKGTPGGPMDLPFMSNSGTKEGETEEEAMVRALEEREAIRNMTAKQGRQRVCPPTLSLFQAQLTLII